MGFFKLGFIMVAALAFASKGNCRPLPQDISDNEYEQKEWELNLFPNDFPENFFGTFGPHKQPLYLCDRGTAGNRFLLPEVPRCKFNYKTKSESNAVSYNLTFWMEDKNINNIIGWNCFAYEREKRTSYNGIFDQRRIEEQLGPWSVSVSHSECKAMVHDQKAPGKDRLMTFKDEGLYASEQDPPYETGWPNTQQVKWTDYYAQQVNIAVDPSDDHKITTLATITRDCLIDEEKCETDNGFLIWKKTDYNKCNLVVSKVLVCALKEDVMICPESSLYLAGLQRKSVCGMTLGATDQLLFTPSVHTWHSELSTTEEVKEKVKIRNTRNTISSQGFLNAQLQYLQDHVLDNFENVAARICSNQQIIIRQAKAEAEDGRPDKLAQAFFGPGVRASMEGHVMLVWSCLKIEKYRFKAQSEVCTREWPVDFQVDGFEQSHSGYIGSSYEITTDYQEVDCPAPPFYFRVGKEAYLLNKLDNLAIRHFDTIPVPGDKEITKDWRKATFKASGDLELKDIGCPTCYLKLTKELSRQKRLYNTLQNPRSDMNDMPPGIQNNFWSLLTMNNLYLALCGIGMIGGVLLILFLCVQCQIIKHCGRSCHSAAEQVEEVAEEIKSKNQIKKEKKRQQKELKKLQQIQENMELNEKRPNHRFEKKELKKQKKEFAKAKREMQINAMNIPLNNFDQPSAPSADDETDFYPTVIDMKNDF